MKDPLFQKLMDFFTGEFIADGKNTFFSFLSGFGYPVDIELFSGKNSEGEFLSANAFEAFADFVNPLPRYTSDLQSIGSSELASIDDIYYRMLEGSLPKILSTDTEESKIEKTRTFRSFKEDKINEFKRAQMLSTAGNNFQKEYSVTEAEPETWYNENVNHWKSAEFKLNIPGNSDAPGVMLKKKAPDFADNRTRELSNKKNTPGTRIKIGKAFKHHSSVMPIAAASEIHNIKNSIKILNSDAIQSILASIVLTVNFKYLAVKINRRQWLDYDFLNNPNWYMQDAAKGEFTAPPSEENPAGNFFAIPVKMILIKELEIQADRLIESLGNDNPVSLSMLSLLNGKVLGNKLNVPGMQVIGFQSEKMKCILPPNNQD